jgi:hypothetical protein
MTAAAEPGAMRSGTATRRRRPRLVIILALGACLVAAGVAALVFQRTYLDTDVTIDAVGPLGSEVDAIPVTFLCQNDPRWSAQKLGRSGYRIGDSGCALCCVAMALSTIEPVGVERLNAHLAGGEGYTAGGLIIWKRVRLVPGWSIGPIATSHDAILASLRERRPVLAKVAIQGGLIHWVLITGVRAGRYLIADPLEPTSDGRRCLDEISPVIHAIRVLQR